MAWFKKKSPDVIDLTKLSEKGILQRSNEIAKRREKQSIHENDIVDLSSMNLDKPQQSETNTNNDEGNALGFLGSFANIGANETSSTNEITSEGSMNVTENLRLARRTNSGDVAGLKNKMEDIEYKLDRFIERIDKIEEKLGDL